MLTVSELIAIASIPNLLNRSGLEPALIAYLLAVVDHPLRSYTGKEADGSRPLEFNSLNLY